MRGHLAEPVASLSAESLQEAVSKPNRLAQGNYILHYGEGYPT